MRTHARRARSAPVGAALLAAVAAAAPGPDVVGAGPVVERVTTAAPFPRGLAMVDGELYVLCRGHVRGLGGVSRAVDDQAGTIYVVDPRVAEPVSVRPPGPAVRENGRVFARPVDPPFRLWDRDAEPPEADRRTDRPYCTLRYHPPTRSFYLCAFSGVDKARTPDDPVAFSKNRTDAILRFDRRTDGWHEVERHDPGAGDVYPHGDPGRDDPPHGWLDGPDNCLPLGDGLYAVSKDNSLLVRYDLGPLAENPGAGPPRGEVVLDHRVRVRGLGMRSLHGHSALASRAGWLYVACRTSSVVFRIPLDDRLRPVTPVIAEIVARFDPYDPATGRSANLTDMGFDDAGRLYVVSAQPARIHRFRPGSAHVYDARDGRAGPWVDLAAAVGRPDLKSENLLHADGWLYVTSGDGYADAAGATGTVFRVRVDG